MLRRSTHIPAFLMTGSHGVSERLASRESGVCRLSERARRTPTPGEEGDMRRITALTLVVATAAIGAAFPLAAAANHGGPHGGSYALKAM